MTISLLLDENVPPGVADFLSARRPAWTVRHIRDIGLRGASDEIVFAWAQQNGSIVLTFDEDFADARMFPAGTHAGVIRLRVWPTTVEAAEEALDRLLQAADDSVLPGSLIVVDRSRIRIRRGARHG